MRRTIATCLVVAGLSIPVASVAEASPPASHVGCPPVESGFQVWDVGTLPYQVDNLVDAGGNGNGWVCARPIDDQTFVGPDGVEHRIYLFMDDVIPAGSG